MTIRKSTLLERSKSLTKWLAENVGERDVANTLKYRAAAGCYAVVQEHHTGIVFLIDDNHPSPAFSLARSVYEGYIRGSWLFVCATEEQVELFMTGEKIRDVNGKSMEVRDLIDALQTKMVYDAGDLMAINSKAWLVLCDYAHVGGRLVSQWNSRDAIEPNFSTASREEILRLTGSMATLAAIGMCEIYQDANLAERIHEQSKLFHEIL